ncbi:MAG: hypothetical protein WCJ81_08850 [bacterium]
MTYYVLIITPMHIPPFVIPLLVGIMIQCIKVVVDTFSHKEKLSFSSFWKAG